MMVLLPVSAAAQYASYANQDSGFQGAVASAASEGGAASSGNGNDDIQAQACSGEYPYSCNGQCWKCNNPADKFTCYENQPKCCPSGYPYYWGGSCHKCPQDYPTECNNGCWKCNNPSHIPSCDNNKFGCCPASHPNFCSKTDSCWTQSWMCGKSISCGGEWKACGSNTDIPYCDGGSLKCCPPDEPNYWGGSCHKCPADKPKQCGGSCYTGNECANPAQPHWNCAKDTTIVCCDSGYPVYCARTDEGEIGGDDTCWKNQNECNTAQKCGGEGWTVCRDPALPAWNCKPDGHSTCCPADTPFFVDGACRKCPADKPKQCGGSCYTGNECANPAQPHWNCAKDTTIVCCDSGYPVYCARTDEGEIGEDATCWKTQNECDTAQKCGNESWTVCRDAVFPYWNCRNDGASRCCPAGYPYLWNSDYFCHTAPEPAVACPVPDGTSSQCDCNTNSDCPPGKPYCEENYPSPFSDGYDACIPTPPEFCGNGNCAGGEDFKSCFVDCEGAAPKGGITVEVVYQTGGVKDKPVQGAYVYLDGIQKGKTGSDGKASFEASFGSRNLKVECPDKVFCSEKNVNVDGTEFASFSCDCALLFATSNLRIRLKAQTPDYPRGYPAANIVVLVDGEKKGTTNQFGTIDIENLPTGESRVDVQLLLLEDGLEKKYTGGVTITLDESHEEKSFILIKGNDPATTITVMEAGKEIFTLEEASPEIIWFAVIYAAIVIGGVIWDAYDYNKCLEEKAELWAPSQDNWNNYNCITSSSMTPDQFNDCMEKGLSRNQNSASGCDFQATMLILNFVPIGGPIKTIGKFGIRITGGVIKAIPHIDDAVEGLYKTYKFVKGGEIFVEVTDKVSKGARYVYKLVDNAFKIFDNIVGLIVNKIARNANTWEIISEKVDNLLLNSAPKDIPKAFLDDIPEKGSARRIAVHGYLGEKAGQEYLAVVKAALEKDGAKVVIVSGTPGSVYKETSKYVAEFTDTGAGLKIFPKDAGGKPIRGKTTGEIDGLMFVNDKPIAIEAKAAQAKTISDSVSSDLVKQQKFFDRKMAAIEGLTGQKPEVLLLIPKGEASVKLGPWWNPFAPKLSDEIDSLAKFLESKGTHMAYDEFPATRQQFLDSAEDIVLMFNLFGR